MAEEDSSERSHASVPRADGPAWAVLGAASRDKADAFLDEQTILARLQAKELAHELALRHWSIRFGNLSAVMKVAFEIAVALIMVSIAVLIGGAVWSAAHDDGLVIEAFSVPPDLAARGMTGEVVAGRMLDKLSALQAQTDTLRAANSYTNNWGNDIKVQIPDTGVSVGEFNRYLHQWLGHQTRITGDVVRVGSALSVTARAGTDAAQSISGSDADLDKLLQQAAEAVYAKTQPYRYGAYLFEHNKLDQAQAVFLELSQTGSPTERAWAFVGLANVFSNRNAMPQAADAARRSVAWKPNFALGWYRVESLTGNVGDEEESLAAGNETLRLLDGSGVDDLQAERVPMMRPPTVFQIDDILGDFLDEARQQVLLRGLSNVLRVVQEGTAYSEAGALAENHDLRGARLAIANAPAMTGASTHGKAGTIVREYAAQNVNYVELLGAAAQDDWPRVLNVARAANALEATLDAQSNANLYLPVQIWPLLAQAEAKSGDVKAAHALIDKTALDCGPCLRARGRIRAIERNWNAAAYWFALAANQGPSIPFADTDWGAMLVREGRYDEAIEKFREANLKGPHFADPLEMWGEALILENRSDLALVKFEEADKYAPNWGRLHLKWGEALSWSGRRDDAKQQFTIAATLDLSAADKSALARMRAMHG